MSKNFIHTLNPKEIASVFNKNILKKAPNDTWLKWHANLESWVDQAIYKTIEKIGDHTHQKFLDIATGTGNNVILLSKMYPTCLFDACDISKLYIEKAKNTALKKNIDNIFFKISDAHHLLYKDKTYNVVTCFFSLMYFKNIDQTIQEFIRVSKPQGKIVITTWGGDNLAFITIMKLISIDKNANYPDSQNPNLFSEKKELLKLFNKYNFIDISIERYQINIKWKGSSNEFWLFFKESNPSIEKILNSLEKIKRKKKEQEIIKELNKFENNGVLFLPTTILISILKKN
ncbi:MULTISPECIES: class I SAM-dependent methyltransferase [Mesonia]|uniref:Methyltransferase YcgJ n=1 Tax=Mesonia oceanica TaxID=2687242 RepID=A0AC61Y5Q7_9FLAO|nr:MULTISPECIES: methyltransferase domain-containing protein [Mesonia]MAN26617.1 hypothetical protein [Mesonia sp.]MAQ40885.1 hypothetical protein [Mesonia sp.]MBJ97806.1 hypothetical protein [Flavobacteriaceae bacterium]VVU99514.1 putative methyltransferase YcgJ [Mesonia oceanica]|tara:strand:+ start:4272 stop:5135 length:864 start_codon:yes stop_codon:yes gene_type:complete